MSPDERCVDARELVAEVALGIADGEDRARVLEHVADCADCRRELERQSGIADELLALAPAQEPPPGFELGVLSAIQPPAPKRRSLLRPALALAAVVVAVGLTAGAMQMAFREDRRLADEYRDALDEAKGTYFGAMRLLDAAGRPGGVLFRYQGSPSWILVTVAPEHRSRVERAELVDRAGRVLPLAAFELAGGAWGGSIPLALADIAAVHLVDGNGRTVLAARF
jgi:hypothetical protein